MADDQEDQTPPAEEMERVFEHVIRERSASTAHASDAVAAFSRIRARWGSPGATVSGSVATDVSDLVTLIGVQPSVLQDRIVVGTVTAKIEDRKGHPESSGGQATFFRLRAPRLPEEHEGYHFLGSVTHVTRSGRLSSTMRLQDSHDSTLEVRDGDISPDVVRRSFTESYRRNLHAVFRTLSAAYERVMPL